MATATYTAEAAQASRRVQWLVEIDIDRCTLVYTQGACAVADAGDGSRCYYSFPTCQIAAQYVKGTRTYYFCLADVPWADDTLQVYPLLRKLTAIPQRIDPAKISVFPQQIKFEMTRDYLPPVNDHEKGTGFFNTTTVGEFWRNLFARNSNYSGRTVRVKRGFYKEAGYVLADFDQVGPDFQLKSYEIRGERVTITAESSLRKLDTRQVPVPLSDDNLLTQSGGINASATTFTITNASEIPDPATDGPGGGAFLRNTIYIKIDFEIMSVTSYTGNTLTVVRGAFGTQAVAHAEDAQIFHIVCFGESDGTPDNAVEVIQDLMEFAGIAAADVDTTTFDSIKNIAWPALDVLRIIDKPKKVAKLIQQIKEIRGIVVFLSGVGKWEARVFGPGPATTTLTDDNFIDKHLEIEEDDEDRITRVLYFWDPTADNAFEPDDFGKGVVVVNATLEGPNVFGESRDQTILDLWADSTLPIGQIRNLARRIITRRRYGTRTFTFRLDTRDATGLDVGDGREVQSSILTGIAGEELVRPVMIVAKKEVSRGATEFEAVDTSFSGPFLRMGPDTMASTYDSSTAADKAFGYWGDTDNRVGTTKAIGYVYF